MNRIETNYIELYVEGEKSGSRTVTLTCEDPIEVTYEQFTNRLNGMVRVSITDNFTTEVKFNISFSDLWMYGETYSGLIHARLSGGVDSLDVPVVINCSDTLIYSDVPNDTVIDVVDGIHITYSSVPDVNRVWIVFEDGSETDITDLLNGQTIDLTYEYLLNRFGVADYDYICATNGLSQIAHKLKKVVYKLEIIGAAVKRINWERQRVSFFLRSTRNNKSYLFDVSASDELMIDTYLVDANTGIYELSCLVDENDLDIEREFIINVVQRESKYEIQFKILQETSPGEYIYPEFVPIDFIFRISYKLLSPGDVYDVFSYGTGVNISDIQIYDDTFKLLDYSITPDPENRIQRVMITQKDDKSSRRSYLYVNFNYDNVNWDSGGYKIGFNTENSTSDFVPSVINPARYVLCNNYTPKGRGGADVFRNMTKLISVEGSQYFHTSNITNMRYMFRNCYSLTSIPLLDTSNVTDMLDMFRNCYSLTSIPLLDTSNVTTMFGTFDDCESLTTIPQLDTSKVTSMRYMFMHCDSLTTIPQLNTSNVTDMVQMFLGCFSLTTIPQLDTSNVTNMGSMFDDCESLTTIPQLDTSNVTSVYYMFNNCSSLTDVGGFKNLKVDLDLSDSPLLTHESLMNVINNLASVTNETLSLGETNLAKLIDDEKMIAINKGWTLS